MNRGIYARNLTVPTLNPVFWVTLFALAVCAWAPNVLAQGMGGADPQMRHEKMAKILELDAAQKTQFDALHKRMHPKMMAQKGLKMSNQQRFMNLDPLAENYTDELTRVAQQSADAARSQMLLRGEMRREMSQILRPEQREKWQQMMQAHMGHTGMAGAGKKGQCSATRGNGSPRGLKDKPGRRFFYD